MTTLATKLLIWSPTLQIHQPQRMMVACGSNHQVCQHALVAAVNDQVQVWKERKDTAVMRDCTEHHWRLSFPGAQGHSTARVPAGRGEGKGVAASCVSLCVIVMSPRRVPTLPWTSAITYLLK